MVNSKASKGSFLGRKNLLLWLTGFTILYQAVYQFFMMRALHMEALEEEECRVTPATAGAPPSPHCQEVLLFRSWQADVAKLQEPASSEDELVNDVFQRLSQTLAPWNASATGVHQHFEEQREALLARHLEEEERLLAGLNFSLWAPPANNASQEEGGLTALGRQLSSLHHHLDSHELKDFIADLRNSSYSSNQPLDNVLSTSQAPTTSVVDHHEQLHALAQASAGKARQASLEERLAAAGEDSTSWSHTFKKAVRDAQKEMCTQPQRHDREDCKQLLASIERLERQEASVAPENLVGTIQQVQREMCNEPHRRGRADCVQLLAAMAKEGGQLEAKDKARPLKKLSEHSVIMEPSLQAATEECGHATWEREFVDRAQRLHRELCQRPERRSREDCIEFLASEDHHNTSSSGWSRGFLRSMRAAQREMCLEPQRAGRTDCVQLLASIAKAEHEEAAQEFREHTALLESGLEAAAADHTAWEQEFAQRATRIHRELCSDPARRSRKDCVEFLAAEDRGRSQEESSSVVEASGPASSAAAGGGQVRDPATWSRSFMRTVRAAQREMCHQPHRAGREDCHKLLRSIAKAEHEDDLAELRAQMAQLDSGLHHVAEQHEAWERSFAEKARQVRRELCLESPKHRDRPDCVEFFTTVPPSEQGDVSAAAGDADGGLHGDAWSRNFTHAVRASQREMCKEPQRRGRPDCVALLAAIAAAEHREGEEVHAASVAHRVASAALRANLSAESAAWAVKLHREEAMRAVNRTHWERELLERYQVPATPPKEDDSTSLSAAATSHTSLRAGRQQLHWSTVAHWSATHAALAATSWLPSVGGGGLASTSGASTAGHLSYDRRTLHAARWAGMIPKAACITALRSGHEAKPKMAQFIAEFNAQTYEGPSQMVIVYHANDTEAARLVKLYADGSRIKAVVAQGAEALPSTTAMRFGAWSAGEDAEVIFHWEFEARHDPDRLGLQVRALALGGRPGCLLEKGGDYQEETLAGEAKWMQRHWYPHMAYQRDSLKVWEESQIVEVDMDSSDTPAA